MATHPQTLYGLADSPVDLAAFMLDHGDGTGQPGLVTQVLEGTLQSDLTRDDLLDNITHYWLTNTGSPRLARRRGSRDVPVASRGGPCSPMCTCPRGHVVLVDIWTFTCSYRLRTEPYVRTWSQAYRTDGLVVIGVHTVRPCRVRGAPRSRGKVVGTAPPGRVHRHLHQKALVKATGRGGAPGSGTHVPEAGSPAKHGRSDATAVHRHMRRHRPGPLAGTSSHKEGIVMTAHWPVPAGLHSDSARLPSRVSCRRSTAPRDGSIRRR